MTKREELRALNVVIDLVKKTKLIGSDRGLLIKLLITLCVDIRKGGKND